MGLTESVFTNEYRAFRSSYREKEQKYDILYGNYNLLENIYKPREHLIEKILNHSSLAKFDSSQKYQAFMYQNSHKNIAKVFYYSILNSTTCSDHSMKQIITIELGNNLENFVTLSNYQS